MVDEPPDLVGEALDPLVEVVELGQDLADDDGVERAEPPLEGPRAPAYLGTDAAEGEVGQHIGIAGAANQGVEDGPAGDPEDVVATEESLRPASWGIRSRLPAPGIGTSR